MKKKLVIIMLLIGLLAGCSKVTCENEEELYIEFRVVEIHGYIDESINLLSPNIIVDTNGEVSYQGDTVYPVEGEYEVTYVVTSLEDPSKTKEYVIPVIIEGERPIFEHGYAISYLTYKTSFEVFEKMETRFVVEIPKHYDTGGACRISMDEVGIYLAGPYISIVRGCIDGGWQSTWKGMYTPIGENLYYVFNIHNEVVMTGETEDYSDPIKMEEGVYEAYFYISSLDKEGSLYYFMEYPEEGNYENPMNELISITWD